MTKAKKTPSPKTLMDAQEALCAFAGNSKRVIGVPPGPNALKVVPPTAEEIRRWFANSKARSKI